MTEEQKRLFDKLTEDRLENARVIEKPSMSGTKDTVVEKYSDQAHFIYELIQNADDAGAKAVSFELFHDKLVFIHDGTRLFSITDVDNETEDTANGTLGDLNAITSIANSNKTAASIGKFGVGFKAVFQYTTTPYIYDPYISFKIERFLVPVCIDDNCPYRIGKKTAFVFPFNHPTRNEDEAFRDIADKLSNLVFPTLFLKNLRKVEYKIEGRPGGTYRKRTMEERSFPGTTAELLDLTGNENNKIWMFTRRNSEGYQYSVGFFVDKNQKLTKTEYYAFCFFPTKKTTHLNFIIHAPFLLTDSREGIKATNPHNRILINLLAELAADSLVYLRDIGLEAGKRIIDDRIIDYIPYERALYIPHDPTSDISFQPFYDRILEKLSEEKIIPAGDEYCYAEDANMAPSLVISSLFSNAQLAQLCGNEDARWVFTSVNWDAIKRLHNGQDDYIKELIPSVFDTIDSVLKNIDADFIANQSIEWLPKLYSFLRENSQRVERYRTYPIFLDINGKPTAAYDSRGNATLFLDDGSNEGYSIIHEKLYGYEDTKEILHILKIKTPEIKDRIYNKILKKETFDGIADFRAMLDYYIQLKGAGQDTSNFIRDIRGKPFVLAISCNGGIEKETLAPSQIYYPEENLLCYFNGVEDAWVVDKEAYHKVLSPNENIYLPFFLSDIGLSKHVRKIETKLDDAVARKTYAGQGPFDYGTRRNQCSFTEYAPHGIDDVLKRIVDNSDEKLASIVWQELCYYFSSNKSFHYLYPIYGIYKYFYYNIQEKIFISNTAKNLKTCKWIKGSQGAWLSPSECKLQDLKGSYDVTSDGAKMLIDFFEIKDAHPEYEKLSPEIREKIELLDKLKEFGFDKCSDEQLRAAKRWLERQEPEPPLSPPSQKTPPVKKWLSDLEIRLEHPTPESPEPPLQSGDSDPHTPISFNAEEKIKEAKQRCEAEISKIAQQEEAQRRVSDCAKYTYGWFSGLLELEAIANGENDANSREVSISFAKVESDPKQMHSLTLSQANKNIPQVMDQLVNIPLNLTLEGGESRKLIIEAIGVKSNSLQIVVKPEDWFVGMDWSRVTEANIHTKSPSFLLRELQNEFAGLKQSLKLTDDYDMQSNLCENIRFVFGPPGTGKTTYLAKEILIPKVAAHDKIKILVLTPTNKASDVIAERIMKLMGEDHDYEDWLIRYGITDNPDIGSSPIYHGKEVPFSGYDQSVVITTMARLPYDYFIGENNDFIYLRDIEWDYVVVDEASMIPLVQMVYMLYRIKPTEFIVAGDPFQIEPPMAVQNWKGENIYSMVKLETFSDGVDTVPHRYDIKLLTTQYRSIESVGEVYSQLTYGGVLKHARSDDEIRPLNIERFLGEYQSLNIIRFPVEKYEGIYKAKHLKQSNYQVYSALFAFEFAEYLSQALVRCNDSSEQFSIGIISPYNAQAGLIDKLLKSAQIPESVTVTCGTIHGFQGDECDIVIAVFNTPPKISTNEQMFLNRQNIVNVAISRAKDYLFVLMPDDDTENLDDLKLIRNMEKLIKRSNYQDYDTHELEELLFDDPTYIEDNSFATGHQMVNVYGDPEKRYEIRSEENAIDVRVHGFSEYALFAKEDEEARPRTKEEILEMLIDKIVSHPTFGEGSIESIENDYMKIHFSDGIHKFQFPDSLKSHLSVLDGEFDTIFNRFLDSVCLV